MKTTKYYKLLASIVLVSTLTTYTTSYLLKEELTMKRLPVTKKEKGTSLFMRTKIETDLNEAVITIKMIANHKDMITNTIARSRITANTIIIHTKNTRDISIINMGM